MKILKKALMCIVPFIILMIACENMPDAETVTLDPSAMTIKVGERRSIKASVTPEGALALFLWGTTNITAAYVDDTGEVTGLAEGNTTIIATTFLNNISGTSNVTVVKDPAIIGVLDKPVISPKEGAYNTSQTITMTATPGASIKYTIDGSKPTPDNGILYVAPFMINSNTNVKAIAYNVTGYAYSLTTSAAYTIDPNVYVNGDSGNDTNPGTISQPKKTIQSAIYAAKPNQEVRVAQGTYNTSLDMKDGVSLMGGYSSDFNSRNSQKNITTINDTDGYCVIYCDDLNSYNTTIDGFTLNSGNSNKTTAGILAFGNNYLTISNNIINAEFGDETSLSIGIIDTDEGINDDLVVIKNNTINGGRSRINYAECINSYYSNLIIMNNTINGDGENCNGSYGIRCDYSSLSLINNTIDGGKGTNEAIALEIRGSNPRIENNIIFTSGGKIRYGINFYNYDNTYPKTVRNNCIFDCPTALYNDYNNRIKINDLNTVITTNEGTQTLGYWGNISEIPMFLNQASGDWHLQTNSPLNVRGGGMIVTGISGISTDKDGVTRTWQFPTGMTNTSALGWSMGAYEMN